MAVMKRLTPEKKAYLMLLLDEKQYTISYITKKLKISRSTVLRYKRKGLKTLERNERRLSEGRPRLLDSRGERRLKRSVNKLRQENPNFTCKSLMASMSLTANDLSIRTFRRYLNRQGYGYRAARRKGVSN